MRTKGINHSKLKQNNWGLVLELIATNQARTRIELAKESGLSKMTVSNIIGDFIKKGIVSEMGAALVEEQGRNPISLMISQNAPKVVGVDIHRTECVATLSTLDLQILRLERCPLTKENSAKVFEIIIKLIDEVVKECGIDKILGIGVGGSGPLDIDRGIILNPPDFHDLKELRVTETLWKHYHIPVYMDSQYNCAALAEKYFGAGQNYQDFIVVGIMRGVGSGVVVNGKMLRSSNGLTSELGHISVDCTGPVCECGNRGCLELYVGSDVLTEKLVAATGMMKSFREFCEMAESPCIEEVEGIWLDMVIRLGAALTSAVNILNSQIVIIEHEGYFIPDRFLRKLEERINRQILAENYHHISVIKSPFKNQAHIQGCACVILNRVFEGDMKCEIFEE